MSYLAPVYFVRKAIDASEAKVFMAMRDAFIRAYMAGVILALAAVFAVMINQSIGQPLVGALLFPVGFSMLYLLGCDLLTGVVVLTPLALIDRRPRVNVGNVLRNWAVVFLGDFAGALTVAVMMSVVFTFGSAAPPNPVGTAIAGIGEARTLGHSKYGASGMLTLFVRAVTCNWMVSTGVIGAVLSTSVPGKVIAMWMAIAMFLFMTFEHSVVNMFLLPSALIMGGFAFTGLMLYATHARTGAPRATRLGVPVASPAE